MNTIKDYCNLLNGYSFKSDKYVDNGIRVVRITNVQKGEFVDADPKYYPLSEEKEIHDYLLQENDLLISLTGNVGRVCKISKEYLPAGLNQRVACLRIKNEKLLKDYLYFYLMRNQFENDCISNSKGIAQLNLSTIWLENYPINVPSLDKQEVIVKNLSIINKNITDLKENLESLNELTKSRFIEMFGNPVLNEKNWKKDMLGNHISVQGGYAFKSTEFKDNGIPVLRIGNINSGKFKQTNMVYWDKEEKLINYEVYPNDLVLSLTGTAGKDDYGNICVMDHTFEIYYLNQRNAKLKIKDSFNYLFVKEMLAHQDVKNELIGTNHGVRQGNILNKDIQNLVVIIPPIKLQDEFASFVEQIDKLKFTEKEQLLHCS